MAQIGPFKLSGFGGWLAWLLVHIARTVGLRVRSLVVASWISGYVFADRPVRLITGPRADSPGGARPAAPIAVTGPARTEPTEVIANTRSQP